MGFELAELKDRTPIYTVEEAFERIYGGDEGLLETHEPILDLIRSVDFEKPLPLADWPHQLHHIQTVRNIAIDGIAWQLGFSNELIQKLDIAVHLHDFFYRYPVPNLPFDFPRREHGFAGELLAYMYTGDRDIATAIFNHTWDRYRDQPLVKALVWADRLAGMGWSGIIRQAYYHGYRHSDMTEKSEREIVDERKLCDTRWSRELIFKSEEIGYESSVKEFVLTDVLGWALKHGKAEELALDCQELVYRFNGGLYPVRGSKDGVIEMRYVTGVDVEILGASVKARPLFEFMDIVKDRAA